MDGQVPGRRGEQLPGGCREGGPSPLLESTTFPRPARSSLRASSLLEWTRGAGLQRRCRGQERGHSAGATHWILQLPGGAVTTAATSAPAMPEACPAWLSRCGNPAPGAAQLPRAWRWRFPVLHRGSGQAWAVPVTTGRSPLQGRKGALRSQQVWGVGLWGCSGSGPGKRKEGQAPQGLAPSPLCPLPWSHQAPGGQSWSAQRPCLRDHSAAWSTWPGLARRLVMLGAFSQAWEPKGPQEPQGREGGPH